MSRLLATVVLGKGKTPRPIRSSNSGPRGGPSLTSTKEQVLTVDRSLHPQAEPSPQPWHERVSTPWQVPWSEGTIARYWTVAGATVDIAYASHSGLLIATCTGCEQIERTDTGGLLTDPPEKEAARIEKALPQSRELAQAHAAECRALPRPEQ